MVSSDLSWRVEQKDARCVHGVIYHVADILLRLEFVYLFFQLAGYCQW